MVSGGSEIRKKTFQLTFLIQDILLDEKFRDTNFSIPIDNIQMEGTVSQIFHIGPSFCFMKCRK